MTTNIYLFLFFLYLLTTKQDILPKYVAHQKVLTKGPNEEFHVQHDSYFLKGINETLHP